MASAARTNLILDISITAICGLQEVGADLLFSVQNLRECYDAREIILSNFPLKSDFFGLGFVQKCAS